MSVLHGGCGGIDLICYDHDLIAFSFEHIVCVNWLFLARASTVFGENLDTNS
jgi:hypothetical protein